MKNSYISFERRNRVKAKKLILTSMILLGLVALIPGKALAVDGANQVEDFTLTIPTVTDVSLTPGSNTFGVIDLADFNEVVNDATVGTGHVVTVGDGYNGGAGISYVQTNATSTSGYDHVRIDFEPVDGTDLITVADNNPTFTLNIADSGGIADVDIIITADSNNAADPLMEDDAANTTDFAFVDANTIQCNAIDFDATGTSYLDLRMDLDESTVGFDDQPTSLDLRVTVTIADS